MKQQIHTEIQTVAGSAAKKEKPSYEYKQQWLTIEQQQ